MNSAVLFVMFNNPERTKRAFEGVRAARPPRIYLAADGPRRTVASDGTSCAATRNMVESMLDWPCEVQRYYRDANAGIKVNVKEAIDWFFTAEPEGVIIEDDCVAAPEFFRFCDELLARYRDDSRVGSICGTSYDRHSVVPDSYYASQFPDIWGWATWRDRWFQYDYEMAEWPAWAKDRGLRQLLGADERVERYWAAIFDAVRSGAINTWDYQWIATRWRLGTVSIHPSVPLVQNIGFGPGATNTSAPRLPGYCRPVRGMKFPLRHPSTLELNPRIEREIWSWRFQLSFGADMLRLAKTPARQLKRWIVKATKARG